MIVNSLTPYDIYDSIIIHVINNFKIKHKESLHISIDHSFCKDDFTTLMFTLRIGLHLFLFGLDVFQVQTILKHLILI